MGKELTKESIDNICANIKEYGLTINLAAKSVGYSNNSIHVFRSNGRKLIKQLEAGEIDYDSLSYYDKCQIYSVEAIDKAEGDYAKKLMQAIVLEASTSGKSALELLQLRFNGEYNKKLESTNTNIEVAARDVASNDELAEYVRSILEPTE